MNWSGGKDSSLCLHKIFTEGKYDVNYLLTSVNIAHQRISMHGVRIELLKQQADSIGIPLKLIELPEQPGMAEYEMEMEKKINEISNEGIHHSIFGDIFLEDLKVYRENKLRPLGIDCVFPLWKISTKKLMQEFLDLGFKSIIVCVNEKFLDRSFCGRMIDQSFVNDLPESVDPCGENGEYHSFVFDGPIFKKPIPFSKGEIVYREYAKPKEDKNDHYKTVCVEEKNYGFYFCDLMPVSPIEKK
ncbi:MAG: diphthine--ammonia ligase [Bacteroidetes bacterium]|nr:diphthine--ammonia ligase [Bacteroidota bacterium]